jgi:hypothetical protein
VSIETMAGTDALAVPPEEVTAMSAGDSERHDEM